MSNLLDSFDESKFLCSGCKKYFDKKIGFSAYCVFCLIKENNAIELKFKASMNRKFLELFWQESLRKNEQESS
jgi:hypothetical protein